MLQHLTQINISDFNSSLKIINIVVASIIINKPMHQHEFVVYRNRQLIFYPTQYFINRKQVSFQMGKWEWHKMDEVCQVIKEWRIQVLLSFGTQASILQSIKQVMFPNLKTLSFSDHEIQSVEGLHRIYLPMLEELSLTSSNINTIADVRKAYWPNLTQICIGFHKLNELTALCSFLISQKTIYFGIFQEQEKQFCDIRVFAKVQLSSLDIYIQNEKRVKQKAAIRILRRRHQISDDDDD